ncbi:MAG TPA: hypothetical protein PK082_03190 [Phycisphaerae bacterium]|nr:hypothetical protein [Phycisphaerae bacterium]
MKSKYALALWVGAVVCWMLTGCDVRPTPPRTAEGATAKVVYIAPNDQAELQAVTAAEAARVNYRYRLRVLLGYYQRIGSMDKSTWAQRELDNLDQTQTFRWDGVEVVPPKGESVGGADERLLVEYTVGARKEYRLAVAELAAFYERKGDKFKASLIHNVQNRFDPVRTYMYFIEAELPPANLKPVAVIPAADALYAKAERLYRAGKPLPGVTFYDKEREALLAFLELVRDYPQSTKIAMSAYFIAEIYKEYFNEDVRAVHWYERSWQWDPNITQPARFQAAVLWDLRLKNYTKAIECYRASLKYDPERFGNRGTAERRIEELTGKK